MNNYNPKSEDVLLTFGDIIKRRREETGKTLQVLADEVGIDKTYLCKFELNYNLRPAKEPVIRSIAIALNLDPEWLLLKAGKLPYKYQKFFRENPDYFLALFKQLAKEKKEATPKKDNL